MKPYFETELGKLYHGDCLEIMPGLKPKSIDLLVTDPPYGLNYNNGDLASQWEAVFGGKLEKIKPNPIENDGEEAHIIFRGMLKEGKRILKKGACCCCCCCGGGPKPLFARWTLWMDEAIGFKQAVVWDKMGLGMGMHYRRNYEFVLIAQNGSPAHRWNGGNNTPNVWRIGKIIPSEKQHPTQKPVGLNIKIIEIHSDPLDLVLEPFAGHGSALVACERLNRQWIGIEISEKYCEIAAKRIENESKQLKLFANAS